MFRLFAVITVVIGLLLASVSWAADSPKLNLGSIQQEIKSHQKKISQSNSQEVSLLDEIELIDKKLNKQHEKMSQLKAQIGKQEELIASKNRELKAIAGKNKALREHLMKRLKAFYLMGETGFLNVMFSSKTLPELLLRQDAFHSLVTYDKELFQAYRKSVETIERVKESYELEKGVLENFFAQADREEKGLQLVAEEKNQLLKRVQSQKGLYEQALKEMKKAETSLTSTLDIYNREQAKRAQGFARNKGKLPPPIVGKMLHGFEEPRKDGDPTFTHGLSLEASGKTEVTAVYAGEVIFAGYMRGYGNTVIIDHDQEYYTVTARFDQIQVHEGDVVHQGDPLGTTGEIATLFGKGLYFEIRHGSIAEDPEQWLLAGALPN